MCQLYNSFQTCQLKAINRSSLNRQFIKQFCQQCKTVRKRELQRVQCNEAVQHGIIQNKQRDIFSFGTCILAQSALTAPINDLLGNTVLIAGFWGWFFAQFLKIFSRRYETGKWDITAFVDSGGMPSSHSSLSVAMTTSVAIVNGFSSSLFALAVCFTSIVMYDAAGVRRHAGKQAEVLNKIIQLTEQDPPLTEKKLKEVLGHTPVQVFSGALVGLCVSLVYNLRFA
eukprot:TRINITY_DN4693_c0_g3_i2.p1 TRINITY_DN4693_c0_g3~~TRINITY_DN4693_c0_g3_i2.p1  ORF type:complete len:227 (+),score=14.64 TRINITY_DN4693_c0_g3_i2:109-789(+)